MITHWGPYEIAVAVCAFGTAFGIGAVVGVFLLFREEARRG